MTNQFFHRSAVREPAFFFDRAREIDRVTELLVRGQSVALVGPRRIGKTSLLLRLAQTLGAQAISAAYLDCQTWGDLPPGAVFARVAEGLDALMGEERDRQDAAEVPLHTVQRRAAGARRDGRPLVILLDELDALCARAEAHAETLAGLRALAMSDTVRFVTASVRPVQDWLSIEAAARCAASLNFLAQLRLGLFSHAEAAELLAELSARGGRRFSDELIAWLISLAGAHPFYLQIVGYCAFDYFEAHDEADSAHARECIRQSFLDEAAPHWRYAWNTLSEDEQHLLATLPLRAGLARNGVRRLAQAGLVTCEGKAGVLWTSAEWQAFVGRQPVSGLLQMPPVTLDSERRAVLVRGVVTEVPPSEFDLLKCLMEARGRIVTHGQLEEHVWAQTDVDGGERLKSTVKSLRRCLGDAAACIENVRGVGYRFNRLCD